MMLNEHRAEVFNLTDASAKPRRAYFNLQGLPAAAVRVYQVEYVDTASGQPVALALTRLRVRHGRYSTIVPAGMTRQIWLSCYSKKVAAGTYRGQIRLSSRSFHRTIHLRLSIAAIRMPDEMTLDTSLWDYIANRAYGITTGNRDLAARDMVRHLINGAWCNRWSAPLPPAADFDAQGNLIKPVNYKQWDAFIKFWPGMRHYFAYLGFRSKSRFAGLKPGTSACNRAIRQWSADWAKHDLRMGLKPKQVMVCFIDEPYFRARYMATHRLIKPFKEGTRQIGIFVDPTFIRRTVRSALLKQALPVFRLCDLIMPRSGEYLLAGRKCRALFRHLQRGGTQLGFYMCSGSSRLLDPSYYRLQPWEAFSAGAVAQGFWSYSDTCGPDSWNPYPDLYGSSFSPVYLSPHSVSSSKQWEALRAGVEDYEYLVMLADRIGFPDARKLADTVMRRVLKKYSRRHVHSWRQVHGPARLEEISYFQNRFSDASRFATAARLEVLARLVRLSGKPRN